jgi:hypothetical protein
MCEPRPFHAENGGDPANPPMSGRAVAWTAASYPVDKSFLKRESCATVLQFAKLSHARSTMMKSDAFLSRRAVGRRDTTWIKEPGFFLFESAVTH